ncbi:ribosomal protein L15 [Micromonospora kangleipakensis]|uniref:Large ribosomal subunit protein uL15 n=1 Tax=Micromonospora kangleipakensis TaxID=1077942 RepID=A0A4Q8BJD0_9ACTN|nr:ribosomal protein L15 [Micromonospora kangleipakensis]
MTIKVHHLRPAPGAKTAKTRVGRGEGSKGKTAGRGTKGSKARKNISAAFEGGQMPIHMRLPKLKGFKNKFKVVFQVVNLDRLAELFPNGGEIGPVELVEAGAVRKGQPVKVLGTGDLGGVALQVSAHAFQRVGQGEDHRRRWLGHRAVRQRYPWRPLSCPRLGGRHGLPGQCAPGNIGFGLCSRAHLPGPGAGC